jgi:hypothetical protein
MAEPAIVVSTMSDILSVCLRGTKEHKDQTESRDHSPRHMSHCCILPQDLMSGSQLNMRSGCRSTMPSYGFGFFTRPLPQAALNSSAEIVRSPSTSTILKLTM